MLWSEFEKDLLFSSEEHNPSWLNDHRRNLVAEAYLSQVSEQVWEKYAAGIVRAPGDTWETPKGKWGGKNQAGTVSYFDTKEEAKSYAQGGELDKEDAGVSELHEGVLDLLEKDFDAVYEEVQKKAPVHEVKGFFTKARERLGRSLKQVADEFKSHEKEGGPVKAFLHVMGVAAQTGFTVGPGLATEFIGTITRTVGGTKVLHEVNKFLNRTAGFGIQMWRVNEEDVKREFRSDVEELSSQYKKEIKSSKSDQDRKEVEEKYQEIYEKRKAKYVEHMEYAVAYNEEENKTIMGKTLFNVMASLVPGMKNKKYKLTKEEEKLGAQYLVYYQSFIGMSAGTLAASKALVAGIGLGAAAGTAITTLSTIAIPTILGSLFYKNLHKGVRSLINSDKSTQVKKHMDDLLNGYATLDDLRDELADKIDEVKSSKDSEEVKDEKIKNLQKEYSEKISEGQKQFRGKKGADEEEGGIHTPSANLLSMLIENIFSDLGNEDPESFLSEGMEGLSDIDVLSSEEKPLPEGFFDSAEEEDQEEKDLKLRKAFDSLWFGWV